MISYKKNLIKIWFGFTTLVILWETLKFFSIIGKCLSILKFIIRADQGFYPKETKLFEEKISELSSCKYVLSTTNGTKAIHNAKDHKVITASYLNIDVISEYLIEDFNDVIILCSGWKGFFNLEDPIFAGSLSKILLASNKFKSKCD